MKCPICNVNNIPGSRFCGDCGTELDFKQSYEIDNGATGMVPKDLGSIISATINIYIKNLVPFTLIFFISHIPSILLALLPGQPHWSLVSTAIVTFFVLYVLASGASVFAVAQYYCQPKINMYYCYRRAWFKIVSLGISNAIFILATAGAAVTIIGIPIAIYFIVVWLFYMEHIMVERLGPMDSLWRSRDLVKGSFSRVFIYVLLFLAISLINLGLSNEFTQLNALVGTIIAVVLSSLLAPFISISKTLIYLDLKIRKEGYTASTLARDIGL